MSYARQMLGTYPGDLTLDAHAEVLAGVIVAATDCAQACITDVDADLSEPHLAEMVTCIRLCQDCSDICAVTATVLGRPARWDGRVIRPLLEACVAICRSCGDECDRHAPRHAHCRVCAEPCRRCEQACGELLRVMK
jgi:methyl coenzyme M reductase beta subunit